LEKCEILLLKKNGKVIKYKNTENIQRELFSIYEKRND